MSEIPVSSYDEVPYSDGVFCYTRPETVGAVAFLHGIDPAPVDRCRVLELGCGTGGNLVPMAQDLPGARFIGVDLSPRQISLGQKTVETLGLENIQLLAHDIAGVDDSFGEFDYIICHGVYSWVPALVQDKILSVCKQRLARHGVAYVSYNTYPGWHIRGMIREMMGFHVSQFADPAERIAQARALLKFLAGTVGGHNTVYGGLLQIEADMLDKSSDTYIYHEHLEEVNAPVWFHQFAGHAQSKGLQYVAEALPSPMVRSLSPEAQQTIEGMSRSLIHAEQYLDFVRNRTFRRSLLCHEGVPLTRPPRPERLTKLYLSGLVQPAAEQADEGAVEEFRTADGATLSTNDLEVKAALRCLAALGRSALTFGQLAERVAARLPGRSLDRPALAGKLLRCYFAKAVDLHLEAPKLAERLGERPLATPLARLQAASERPVTNRCHRNVLLEPFDRLVLRHLDGSRDRRAILEALSALAAEGAFSVAHRGEELRGGEEMTAFLREAIADSLQRLQGSALLA